MKTILAALAATTALVGSAHAASFTINFGAGSQSSNDPATGASATVHFGFTDVADGVEVKLTVTNTTGLGDAFGDGATDGTLTGLTLDLADGVSFVSVDQGLLDGNASFDTFDQSVDFAPFSNDAAVGTFDLYFGDDDNIQGGNPNDGLGEGMSEMLAFIVTGDFDADSLSVAYLAAFQSGAVEAAVRFMQVTGGASDKLLNGTGGGDLVVDDFGEVPIPGAAVLMLTALGAGAAARRRRRG